MRTEINIPIVITIIASLFLSSCDYFFGRFFSNDDRDEIYIENNPDNEENTSNDNMDSYFRQMKCSNKLPDNAYWSEKNPDGTYEAEWDGSKWIPSKYECEWACENCYIAYFARETCEKPIFQGGDGTFEEPFLVASPEHLNNVRYCMDSYYKQTEDIDLTEFVSGIEGGWIPIGNDNEEKVHYFSGVYDGQGYTISNLEIFRPYYENQGLFANTFHAGIKNLGLINVNINGGKNIGGFAGSSYLTTITDCYITGKVKGISITGAFSGNYEASSIRTSYSTVNVEGDDLTGALVGISNESYTENVFFDINVSGQTDDGFGIGKTTEEMKSESTYIDAGWNFLNKWKIEKTLNNGYPVLKNPLEFAGGLGTEDDPFLVACKKDLNNIRFFPSAHFLQISDIDLEGFMSDEEWDSYYYEESSWEPVGTILKKFSGHFDGNGYVISNLYIDDASMNFASLFGITEGAYIKNVVVSNAVVSGNENVGILTGKSINTTITNCGVSGYVKGNKYVGGLSGETTSESSIFQSYSSGTVEGEVNVGGLTGVVTKSSKIANCYSLSSLIQKNSDFVQHTGGMAGYFYNSTAEFSYSTGKISFKDSDENLFKENFAGGEIGTNIFNAVFYESDFSDQNTTAGINVLTPEQMKLRETFTDEGWDFDFIWNIDENTNNGYPNLKWQNN